MVTKTRKTTTKRTTKKPAARKTTRNPRTAGMRYKVFLKVVNGPFKTMAEAKKASAYFNKNGKVGVSNFRKLKLGFFYDTTSGWGVPDAKARNTVVSRLNGYVKKSKIPASRVRITTESV